MKIFDSHCHYNLNPLYTNWQDHWQKAQEHGVIGANVVGTNIETSRRAVEIAQQDERLSAAIGVHPNEYVTVSPADLPTIITQHTTALAMMIGQDKTDQIAAIGETGLDYFRLTAENYQTARSNQQAAFRAHIELANEFEKELIVHVRDKGGKKAKNNQAYWDTLEIIEKFYQHKKRFILHCISGPAEYLQRALEMGAFIGVAANVTYTNADELRELVKLVPQDRLLLETDAPYLPPQEFRGQVCEPWMIEKIAAFFSNLHQNYFN